MELSAEQVREWRDEACENIERIDLATRAAPPGQKHIHLLLRPREARILTLCDALLDRWEA